MNVALAWTSARVTSRFVRTPGKRHRTFDKNITVWGATAGEVGSLTQFLVSEQVTLVVMEATGSKEAVLLSDGI